MLKVLLVNRKAAALLALATLILGLELTSELLQNGPHSLPAWLAPTVLAMAAAASWTVLWGGLKALLKLRFSSIKLLISVAAVGALFLGQWMEAGVVLILFRLSEALEDLGFSQSFAALGALLKKAPKEARVVGGGLQPVEGLAPGTLIEVRPGEAIAVDGFVREGRGLIDQASITGEPLPASRSAGDAVFAGTLNLDGHLRVEVTRTGKDSTLGRIVALTYEAGERKLRLQSFLERFSRVYTPAVFCLALLIGLLPWVLGLDARLWLERALSLLVIACPCALTMATPVAVYAAVSNAAQRGMVIKGGLALERLAAVKAVAFDKTRTLTYGEPVVTDVLPLRGLDVQAVLGAAAGLEALSNHPLARAITERAAMAGARAHPIQGFQDHPGLGISGLCMVCADPQHSLGSPAFADATHGLSDEARQLAERLQQEGKTVAVLADGRGALGLLGLQDRPREDINDAVLALRSLGVEACLLTGDHATAAQSVAAYAGINDWQADLLPQDKVRVIGERQAAGTPMAMVGDGINDAPALATASVGIAMGAVGSDVALENADIALMNNDLSGVATLIRLARRTVGTVRFNIALALGTKAAVLLLALAGWVGLEAAILSDVGVTALVIGHGLGLLRCK